MTPRRLRRWVNMGLVLAAVASVGAAVVTRRTWSSSERLARSNHLVVGYRSDEIRRITLLSGGAKLVLARGDGERRGAPGDDGVALGPGADDVGLEHARWQFVAPYQGEADEAAVDALLRAIEFAPFLRKVDDSTLDRRAAGFDSPEQTIELEMGQVRTRLHVGASGRSVQQGSVTGSLAARSTVSTSYSPVLWNAQTRERTFRMDTTRPSTLQEM